MVERKPDAIFLASIEVAPEFQNQGGATGLISELFREADQSQKPLRLQVLKGNRARRPYERLGFECVEETKTHFVRKRSSATAA